MHLSVLLSSRYTYSACESQVVPQSPQTSDVAWSHAWWRPLFGSSTKPILLFETTSTQTALRDEVTAFTAKQWTEHSRNVGSETQVTIARGWMKEEAAENHLPPSSTQDKTLRAAFLWPSGHEFENQRQFIDVSVFFRARKLPASRLYFDEYFHRLSLFKDPSNRKPAVFAKLKEKKKK